MTAKYKLLKTSHRLYRIWTAMKWRCDSPKYEKYHRYGGRGISYSEAWSSFENFINDMDSTYAPGLTLDRQDNDGNYCKNNCMWTTRSFNSSKDMSQVVSQYTLTGEYIATHISLEDIERKLGYPATTLSRAVRLHKPCKGFRWARFATADDLPSDYEMGVFVSDTKRVAQLDKKTGEVIREWDSAKEASAATGTGVPGISQVAHGKRNSAGGFGWALL